jgi:hypothetical protein
MSESLAIMFQQEREHLSQLQNRLLTVNLQLKFYFFVIKYISIESDWKYSNWCLQRINDNLFMFIKNVSSL